MIEHIPLALFLIVRTLVDGDNLLFTAPLTAFGSVLFWMATLFVAGAVGAILTVPE